ncbi:hypothetical protein OG229_03765 [Streptomyces platensis]|uniref:hypothetical protein n=1 Tax=Streptomyces platensis TaxID=58346 RepID=UPI002E1232A7|nr:hypothetical protein OG229_03765 [Streptomyces platensis]
MSVYHTMIFPSSVELVTRRQIGLKPLIGTEQAVLRRFIDGTRLAQLARDSGIATPGGRPL